MGLATGNSEPAPSTVEAAATDKEQDNYYDEECGGIHDSTPGGNQLAVSRGSSFYAVRETSTGRNGSFGAADVFSIFEGRREFLYRSTLFGNYGGRMLARRVRDGLLASKNRQSHAFSTALDD